MVGFFFLLLEQGIVQVLQQRHILRAGVSKIFAVDEMHTAVNDCLFDGHQTIFAAHHQFAQRKNKIRFQSQRVILLGIVGIDVHRVHILVAVGRNFDDLTFQPLHQRRILSLRVIDDNIIVRHQKRIGNLTFCRETFTRTGSAEDKPIGIFQLLSVHHNQIVRQGVQAVVQRFFSALIKFLRGERDKNRCAAGGKTTLNLNLVICQRQRGH